MKKICLIGFMGVGKTAVGNILATKLNYSFVDIDHEIEKKEKKSIADIFSIKGEEYFRDVENAVLNSSLKADNVVTACGGGINERKDNRDLLARECLVIYLKASIKTIRNRIESEIDNRPKIDKRDILSSIESLLSVRKQSYEMIADITVSTDGLNQNQVADSIIKEINNFQQNLD